MGIDGQGGGKLLKPLSMAKEARKSSSVYRSVWTNLDYPITPGQSPNPRDQRFAFVWVTGKIRKIPGMMRTGARSEVGYGKSIADPQNP